MHPRRTNSDEPRPEPQSDYRLAFDAMAPPRGHLISPLRRLRSDVAFWIVAGILFAALLGVASAESKCAEGGASFACPNCGGITVSDCMECDGYLFTDYQYGLCYDRKLFNTNAENGDSENHYPFLWHDM